MGCSSSSNSVSRGTGGSVGATGGAATTGGHSATGGVATTGGTKAAVTGGTSAAATGGASSTATGGTNEAAAGGTNATAGGGSSSTAAGGTGTSAGGSSAASTGGTTAANVGGSSSETTGGSGGAAGGTAGGSGSTATGGSGGAAGGAIASGGTATEGGTTAGGGGFLSAGGATGQDASVDQESALDAVPGMVDANQAAEDATAVDLLVEDVSSAGDDISPVQDDTAVVDDGPLDDVAVPDAAADLAPNADLSNVDGPGLPIGDSRVLLLHMDEQSWNHTAGEVIDSSGSGNNGTAVGTATTTANGKFGRAGLFDGAGSVTVPDASSIRPTAALTMTAWIFPTGLGVGAQGIIAKRTAYNVDSAYSMFIDTDGKLYVDIDSSNDRFASNTIFANNSWYHVAVVFDGGLSAEQRVRVYVNGVLDIAANETSSTIPPYTSNLDVGLLPGGGNGFVGTIDEVSIWTRALAPTEIATLAAASGPL